MGLTKKNIIIAAITAVVITACGALVLTLGNDDNQERPVFGRGHLRPLDPNLPNPRKQTAEEIINYTKSNKFNNLSSRQKMEYMFHSGHKVMEYQVNKYFKLPEEEKTALLDDVIDSMQQMRQDFEQMRNERPQRPPNQDPNDPNARQQNQRRSRPRITASDIRTISERGTAEQHAKMHKFFSDLRKRAEQRGIKMPEGPGGRGGRPNRR